ncbi:MAG: type II toxin-antitoxin system HicA family toxin [Planctomycetaceae bacterium]|nr:type II toxin-antitoxin system HicA family toxin [Planctomycetaceae bacterium]
MKSRDLIRLIEADGWVVERVAGSHTQSRHPTKPGTGTIPAGGHLAKDIPPGTFSSPTRGRSWGDLPRPVGISEKGQVGRNLPSATRCEWISLLTRWCLLGHPARSSSTTARSDRGWGPSGPAHPPAPLDMIERNGRGVPKFRLGSRDSPRTSDGA